MTSFSCHCLLLKIVSQCKYIGLTRVLAYDYGMHHIQSINKQQPWLFSSKHCLSFAGTAFPILSERKMKISSSVQWAWEWQSSRYQRDSTECRALPCLWPTRYDPQHHFWSPEPARSDSWAEIVVTPEYSHMWHKTNQPTNQTKKTDLHGELSSPPL